MASYGRWPDIYVEVKPAKKRGGGGYTQIVVRALVQMPCGHRIASENLRGDASQKNSLSMRATSLARIAGTKHLHACSRCDR